MPQPNVYKVGQVVLRSVTMPEQVKVRCLRLAMDKFLHKYYNRKKDYWAVDIDKKCDIGDIITIKQIPVKVSPRTFHEVHDMTFKFGAVVDPVTGRRCRGMEFVDENRKVGDDSTRIKATDYSPPAPPPRLDRN